MSESSIVTILITAATVLFAIIGFLIVRLLNNIDESIKGLKTDMNQINNKIDNHDERLIKIETEHAYNH